MNAPFDFVNPDLHAWLVAQGAGNLAAGIARVALAAGYRPPQASSTWNVQQAVQEANALGYEIRQCTINAALLGRRIKGASRQGREWSLEPEGFLDWLQNRYTPRPRKKASLSPAAH